MGDAGKNINWDPRQSTTGKFVTGNYGGFAKDVAGGAQNLYGGTQAILNPDSVNPQEVQLDAPVAPDTSQQDAEALQRSKDEQNKKLLSDQMATQTAQGEEDAFIQARNAARKAKGNTLFQAWG